MFDRVGLFVFLFVLSSSPDVELLCGEELSSSEVHLVILNGRLLGVHRGATSFCKNFRALRRSGLIPYFVSIYENESHRSIYIATDGGRVCRPLILVSRTIPRVKHFHLQELAKGKMTFDDFLKQGLIEYLDVNEENNGKFPLFLSNIRQIQLMISETWTI